MKVNILGQIFEPFFGQVLGQVSDQVFGQIFVQVFGKVIGQGFWTRKYSFAGSTGSKTCCFR